MGKERLVTKLGAAGVDQKAALTVYGTAEFQYGQALNRLVEYRAELNRALPRRDRSLHLHPEELNDFSGRSAQPESAVRPDGCLRLRRLRLGPRPAGLARRRLPVPRRAALGDRREIRARQLFERRPDIGNLKLNCDNTDVALPYIDLVNEMLEALVTPANANTSFQTTLAQAELRAFPENVRNEAYDLLKAADFPMRPRLRPLAGGGAGLPRPPRASRATS